MMVYVKRHILVLLLLLLVIASFSQKLVVNNPLRFLALGDSYTIGQSVAVADRWPNQLVESLKISGIATEKLTIIAQTGWRTDNLINAIERENPDSTYNFVSLLIGVNNQYQGINIEVYPVQFRQLLEKAIALCGGRKKGVFVLSIPDYGYTPFGGYAQVSISAAIDTYNQINKEITMEMGITWYDITPISREAINNPDYLAVDNLHPSGKMYAEWIKLIMESSELEIKTTNVQGQYYNTAALVYPNPASSSINIISPETGNSLAIYNSQGSMVWQSVKSSTEKFYIDVSSWSKGIYYYQIRGNNKTIISGKFLTE